MLWRRKMPKSAMERMKPLDPEELTRREEQMRLKCDECLDKIDWNLLKRHCRTPEAREAYEKFYQETRSKVTNQLTNFVYVRQPDRYLQYYYGKFPYLSVKERALIKWTKGVNLLQKGLPAIRVSALGFGVTLAALMVMVYQKKREN